MRRQWRVFPRPLLESVLNNHGQHHRVLQPLIFHGPRGVGKRTIIHRLLEEWKTAPHIVEYLDFHQGESVPSWTACEDPPSLRLLRSQLERSLESLTKKGVDIGCIGGDQVYTTLKKWHGIDGALLHFLNQNSQSLPNKKKATVKGRDETLFLWQRALWYLSEASGTNDGNLKGSFLPANSWDDEYRRRFMELASWNDALQPGSGNIYRALLHRKKWDSDTKEDLCYFKEALLSLYLAKEVLLIHENWRTDAVQHLNRTGGFSKMLAHSATNWPSLLLEILSEAAEERYFQPKLVINNLDLLRKAARDSSNDPIVDAAMYHDSLLSRLVALGLNERCLPVIFVTSDSYYSYQLYLDFGYPNVFISREAFGWTPEEAKIHMVPDYFSEGEWRVIADVLGSNSRHLSELYALKQSSSCTEILEGKKADGCSDFVDIYLAHLQLNYFSDCSLEILEDPSALALMEVGLLYQQRDPPYIRPISRGIQRCIVRWLVQEKIQLSTLESVQFFWHRMIRGRSYRHLMEGRGY